MHRFASFVVLAAVLVLEGCARPQGPSLASRTGTGLSPSAVGPAVSVLPARRIEPISTPAAPKPTVQKQEPAPTPPRKLPDDPALAAIGAPDSPRAARLIGLSAQRIEYLFGKPQFTRIDKPAEIRQYRNDSCVLDVFLYAGKNDGALSVAHAEIRRRGPAPVDEGVCLGNLLRTHWLQGA